MVEPISMGIIAARLAFKAYQDNEAKNSGLTPAQLKARIDAGDVLARANIQIIERMGEEIESQKNEIARYETRISERDSTLSRLQTRVGNLENKVHQLETSAQEIMRAARQSEILAAKAVASLEEVLAESISIKRTASHQTAAYSKVLIDLRESKRLYALLESEAASNGRKINLLLCVGVLTALTAVFAISLVVLRM